MLKKADKLKDFLNGYRPLDARTVESINQDFAIKYNHESNRIEGNTLTLVETRVFLESGMTVKGKPFKDFLDVINHKHAIDYMMDLINENEPLSERTIKEFNNLILKATEHDKEGGIYRSVPVTISGSPHTPPQPYLIAPEMERIIEDYHNSDEHTIEKIAKFHAKFEAIHPFIEGNGRTGRLVMNMELMKNDYPLAIIKGDEKDIYYEALIEADKGDYSVVTSLIAEEVVNSTKHILNIVDPEWEQKFEKQNKKPNRGMDF
ncbi:hypothetical protein AAEX37_02234 [Oligella sp. MSHR50489EDL]|uniref:Fic family protein n=1 Tax=Oligella sp. MSHR50489EDL TaxID=3139409 RepID=UPI003D817F0C